MTLSTHIGRRVIIQEKFKEYLQEFQISSIEEIRDNDEASPKELILLACTRDFIDFKIDFDLFGSLLSKFWMINESRFNFQKETVIENLCYKIGELQWYIRNDPKRHIDWLCKILDYYKENKHKINSKNKK